MAVSAPEINDARHDHRTREENVILIGDRLSFWFESVDSLRFETALTARREFPADGSGLGVERIELPVVAAGVSRAVRDGRSGGRRTTRGPFPKLLPGLCVDGVDVSVVPAEIKHLVLADRRRDHAIAGREFPFYPMRLPRRLAGVRSRMRGVAAKHRLPMGQGRERNRDQPRDKAEEFHGTVAVARRITRGCSNGPWIIAPLISPDSLRKRPSYVIPNSSDLMVRKSPSWVRRVTGTLFVFLPTITNSRPAVSGPRFANFIVT